MRFLPWILACSLLLAQERPTFRIASNLVRVPVTVYDERGRPIPDLTRDDFKLLDEGASRPIENFVLDTQPLHVALLLDVSGSVKEELDEMRYSALEFAKALDRNDRISVLSFSDQLLLIQQWTNDRRRLQRSLRSLERGYRTALYDALRVTLVRQFEAIEGRKAIVLFTDGLDNESRSTYDDLLEQFIESNAVLFIISRTRMVQPKVQADERVDFVNRVLQNVLRDDQDFVEIFFREKETAMIHLAEASGGRVYFPERLEELHDHYIRLANDLKSQYLLTFFPPPTSSARFRNLEVICFQPAAEVAHRRQYVHPNYED